MTIEDAVVAINRERLVASAHPSMDGRRVEWVVTRKPVGSPRGVGPNPAAALKDMRRLEREAEAEEVLG